MKRRWALLRSNPLRDSQMGDDEIEEIVGGVFGLPALFLFLSYPHALKT